MTIGAADPSHYDPAAARSAGYADVVAPPNMLAAIVEWGVGTPRPSFSPTEPRTTETCPSVTATWGCG
jgi:hypothetical protein